MPRKLSKKQQKLRAKSDDNRYLFNTSRNHRKITAELSYKVEDMVRAMLHCSRDTMRNLLRSKHYDMLLCLERGQWERYDPAELHKYHPEHLFGGPNDGDYSDAFGVFRGLSIAGYGYLGCVNESSRNSLGRDERKHNLRWWFEQIQHGVLHQEHHFNTKPSEELAGTCKHCMRKYGKDDRSTQRLLRQREEGFIKTADRGLFPVLMTIPWQFCEGKQLVLDLMERGEGAA